MLKIYKGSTVNNLKPNRIKNRKSVFTIIYTVFILVILDGFGLFSFASDQMWGPLNTYDITLIFINGIFILQLIRTKLFTLILSTKYLKFLLFIYLLILFIIFTMPLRGPISIVDSARVIRDYLLIPLAFLLYYDISINNNSNYYFKIFLFAALLTSLQIFLNVYNSELVLSLFPNVYVHDGFKFDYFRNVIRTASMIFPHIAAIYMLIKINLGKFNKYTLLLFILFTTAGALQGFRIYFFSMLFVFIIIFMHNLSLKKAIANIMIIMIMGAIVLGFDAAYLNRQIYGKIDSTILELFGYEQGTLTGRYQRDLGYMYPMFFEKPLVGWGFIYYDSEYGRMLGMRSGGIDKSRSLYSVDSGYLSILIQFGIFGTIIIMLCIYKILSNLYKSSNNNIYRLTAFYLWLFMVLSLPTHSALIARHGLLPMCIIMALTFIKSDIAKDNGKAII